MRAVAGRILWALGAYVALLAVVLVAYRGCLRHGFIADDFINLQFLRDLSPPYANVFDPTAGYSDPVTAARFLPVRVLVFLGLERAFDLDATKFHAASIAFHALNALLVGRLAKSVFGGKAVPVLAALIFALARPNAQNVCWVASIANLFGTTFLFASVALYLRRPPAGPLHSVRALAFWLLAPLLLVASFFCRYDAATTALFLAPLWAKDILARRPFARLFAAAAALGTGAALFLARVSLERFPEPRLQLGFAPVRIVYFACDSFLPFEAPVPVKIALLVALVGGAVALRDRRVAYLLYGILTGGLFWATVVYLDLAPRYLYPYSALSAMVVAVLAERAAAGIFRGRARLAPAAALVVGGAYALYNGWQVARNDVVWFEYLSGPGTKLLALYQAQRAAGATAPLTVRMAPNFLLTYADLSFFRPYVEVLRPKDERAADVVIDTERDRFVAYWGTDFGAAFWWYPWFLK